MAYLEVKGTGVEHEKNRIILLTLKTRKQHTPEQHPIYRYLSYTSFMNSNPSLSNKNNFLYVKSIKGRKKERKKKLNFVTGS